MKNTEFKKFTELQNVKSHSISEILKLQNSAEYQI